MKGSDFVAITINIGGELLKLDVKFDDQNLVRDTERDIKAFIERKRKADPDMSDRQILAMAAYQFASWYHQLLKIQNDAIEIANLNCQHIDEIISPEEDPIL